MRVVAVIGAGKVGATAAFFLAERKVADKVLLTDSRRAKAAAESRDMITSLQRIPGAGVVHAVDLQDCIQADVVVLTAAAPVRLGQTRNQMFVANARILSEIVSELEKAGFTGNYIVVSNPVDLLTHFLVDQCKVHSTRIVGTGTVLDTMRLETLIFERLGYKHIPIPTMGEHGENLIVDWGSLSESGLRVTEEAKEDLRRGTISYAYEIMKGKGGTNYGIAEAITQIVESNLKGDGNILPMSLEFQGELGINGISLSVPAHFDKRGVAHVVVSDVSDEVANELKRVAHEMDAMYDEVIAELNNQK